MRVKAKAEPEQASKELAAALFNEWKDPSCRLDIMEAKSRKALADRNFGWFKLFKLELEGKVTWRTFNAHSQGKDQR